MNRCEWAGCDERAHAVAGGWSLCKRHTWEHKRVICSDVYAATAHGPHGTDPHPAPSEYLWVRYDGNLHPSGTFLPVVAVLNRRPPREQGVA